jgi:capsid assembly protease
MPDRLIVEYFTTRVWGLHEPVLKKLAGVIGRHAQGHRLSAIQIQTVVHDRRESAAEHRAQSRGLGRSGPGYFMIENLAVIPIIGVIHNRAHSVQDVSQPAGVSCEDIGQAIGNAIEAPNVTAIVLDLDSPGGDTAGMADLSDFILRCSRIKPIIAHADAALSAAGWIASQCNSTYVGEIGACGALGVYCPITDESERFADEGIEVHIVRAPEDGLKGLGHPGTVVDDEQLAELQNQVNCVYQVMVAHVARGLNVSKSKIEELADGRVFIGRQAVRAGLADGVRSFDDLVDEMLEEYQSPVQSPRIAGDPKPRAKGNHIMSATSTDPAVAAELARERFKAGTEPATAFWALVQREQRGEKSTTRAQAIATVVRRCPALHERMLADQQARVQQQEKEIIGQDGSKSVRRLAELRR